MLFNILPTCPFKFVCRISGKYQIKAEYLPQGCIFAQNMIFLPLLLFKNNIFVPPSFPKKYYFFLPRYVEWKFSTFSQFSTSSPGLIFAFCLTNQYFPQPTNNSYFYPGGGGHNEKYTTLHYLIWWICTSHTSLKT